MSQLDDMGDPAEALLDAAHTWLRAHVPDVHELPIVDDPTGLDVDGRALLAQIDDLIDQRVTALTAAALDEQPDWLRRLGPPPTSIGGRDAWLAEISATVAHTDTLTTRPTTTPAPAAPEPAAAASR